MKTKSSTAAHRPRSAKRASQEADILAWIMHAPQTLTTLHQLTGLPKNTISGRLSDLQAKGIVVGFETAPENTPTGKMINVTVYEYEPDEHRQIDHAYNRRRNLDIRAIESCLKRKSEVYPQFLVAGMRAFLQLEKELGHLHSDYKHPDSCNKSCGPGDYRPGGKCDKNGYYKQPEGARPPDKFTGV